MFRLDAQDQQRISYGMAVEVVGGLLNEIVRRRDAHMVACGGDMDVWQSWQAHVSRAVRMKRRANDGGYVLDGPLVFDLPDGETLTLSLVE